MRLLLALALALFFAPVAQGQVAVEANTGIPAPMLYGTGTPDASYACNTSTANMVFIQTDATAGRLWMCDNSTGTLAWEHLVAPFIATATSGMITGGSFILGGCTAATTLTIAGATPGTNTAVAQPIWSSPPSGNVGLFHIAAWVSAANTLTIQACSFGTLSSVPNFKAKVLLY